jgi:RimJ/RimL family protein N-acetyltransferase
MADDPVARYLLSSYPKSTILEDGTSVTLRSLIPQDRAEVGEFFERVPEEDRAFLKEDLFNRYEVEVWLDEIDIERETVIVAVAGKQIVGTTVLQRQRHGWSRHVGEIRIVADPTFRRRGLGHALADAIIDLAWKSSSPKWSQTGPGRFASLSGSVSKPRLLSTIRLRTGTAALMTCW